MKYPLLMEAVDHLIQQRRYYDAERLMGEAREYAHAKPVVGWEELAARAVYDELIAAGHRPPTQRELANELVARKLWPAATKDVLDAVTSGAV